MECINTNNVICRHFNVAPGSIFVTTGITELKGFGFFYFRHSMDTVYMGAKQFNDNIDNIHEIIHPLTLQLSDIWCNIRIIDLVELEGRGWLF